MTTLIPQLDQLLGIPFPVKQGFDNAHRPVPVQIADHQLQGQVHRAQGLAQVLQMRGATPHQFGPLTGERAQPTNRRGGPKGPVQQPIRVEFLQPRAIQPVALAPRHGFDPVRIHQLHFDPARLQLVIQGQPVDAGGRHRHRGNRMAPRPFDQGVLLGAEHPKDSHR